jgi:RecA-family ATPase
MEQQNHNPVEATGSVQCAPITDNQAGIVNLVDQVIPGPDESQKVEDSTEKKKGHQIPSMGFATGKELYDMYTEEKPHLFHGFIPRESLIALTGTSDVGKSLFALNLALHIASGRDSFIGRALHPEHKRVLYVSTEDGNHDLGGRLRKLVQSPMEREGIERIRFLVCTGPETIKHVEKYFAKYPADLVIIDVVTDLFDGNTNDVSHVKKFLNILKDLIFRHGCSVLYLHHTRKGSQKEGEADKDHTLGSMAWTAAPRGVMMLRKDSQYQDGRHRKLSLVKGNFASEEDKSKSLSIVFDADTLRFTRATLTTQGLEMDEEPSQPYTKTTDPRIIAPVLELQEKGFTLVETVDELKRRGLEAGKTVVSTIRNNHKNDDVKLDNPENLLG